MGAGGGWEGMELLRQFRREAEPHRGPAWGGVCTHYAQYTQAGSSQHRVACLHEGPLAMPVVAYFDSPPG